MSDADDAIEIDPDPTRDRQRREEVVPHVSLPDVDASSWRATLLDGTPEVVAGAVESVELHPRDPDMLERKDAYRRRHKSADEMCGTGRRPGSAAALAAAKLPLVVCGREGCVALVQLNAMRRAARAAGRDFAEGDGCGARSCARRYRPARFVTTQRKWIVQLANGVRPLIARPGTAAQAAALRVVGGALSAALAAAESRLG